MFSSFRTGQTIVVSERWRGLLWAAIPHRCITSNDRELVTYLPRGTIATYASNRDLPATKHLPRDERKLEAMRTCVYEVVERPFGMSQLHFFAPNRMAHVNLGWTEDGDFAGWYINFELPLVATPDGVESKDLVLDMTISPDYRWQWKDEADFAAAIQSGILSPDLQPLLTDEADRVIALCDKRSGPFEPTWTDWKPNPEWANPQLPSAYQGNGRLWEHG